MPKAKQQIILLDLNATLSANFEEVFGKAPPPEVEPYGIAAFSPAVPQTAFDRRILEVERYRRWLVKWLEDNADFAVYLFTVRKIEHAVCTLKSIEYKTGWLPHRAYFNYTEHTGAGGAPKAKEVMLTERILKEAKPEQVFAFESNQASRAMFRKHGVEAQWIQSEKDIPSRERILEPREWLIKRIRKVIQMRQTATGEEAKALTKERIRLRRRLQTLLRKRIQDLLSVDMAEVIRITSIEVEGKTIKM